MAFVGFDLDETLGHFSSVKGYMFFAFPQSVYSGQKQGLEPFVPSDALKRKMNDFFIAFAHCLAEHEPEVGILRQGIIPIMKHLADAKREGFVNEIAIYSNTANIGNLFLASYMIEYLLGEKGIFCDHVYWYDPRRVDEISKGRASGSDKTIDTLKKIFEGEKCGNFKDIQNENVYFFDDLVHENIFNAIGKDNYFNVNPFENQADAGQVKECFITAGDSVGIFEDKEYQSYIQPILNNYSLDASLGIDSILKFVKKISRSAGKRVFKDDSGKILKRLQALFPLGSSEGGGSKTRKMRKTLKKRRSSKKTLRRRKN